ncbi:MAG: response regulator transcription factor [Chloroflexi bacterium]|nr:response regulator transcription factor [Chloroflexota bacterium]
MHLKTHPLDEDSRSWICYTKVTMETRVLFIGEGLFQEGLTHILADQPALEIVAGADSWEEARARMAQEQPDIIIVDHANAQLREVDLAPLLDSGVENLKVVYLTLAENRMIVHNRQEIINATPTDLLQALKGFTR